MPPCAGYFGYPFQNKQGKSCVEHLARDGDKEEKIGVVVIINTFLLNGYPKEPAHLEALVGANVPVIFIVYHLEDDALYWEDSKHYVKTTSRSCEQPDKISKRPHRDMLY